MTDFNPEESIWITWERQPRNISMARTLNVPLYEFIDSRSRWVKHPLLLLKTIKLIITKKPGFLFVQNPSIVLSFFAMLMSKLLRFKLIVDAHNAGVFPQEGKSKALNLIAKIIIKNSSLTIVTNKYLESHVTAMGGSAVVMPDPLPEYAVKKHEQNESEKNTFLFICTWADDEPYHEVIKAFSELGDNYILRVTGKYAKKLSEDFVSSLPKNIELLGFISEADYQEELASASFTIDLTLRDNCLVCGAYESIAIGTPGIISDTQVNREVFDRGFVLAKNGTSEIKKAALECISIRGDLRQDISEMRLRHLQRTDAGVNSLKEKLSSI